MLLSSQYLEKHRNQSVISNSINTLAVVPDETGKRHRWVRDDRLLQKAVRNATIIILRDVSVTDRSQYDNIKGDEREHPIVNWFIVNQFAITMTAYNDTSAQS